MKKLMQSLIVMSIVLILFAETIAAMNGNNDESGKRNFGVTIDNKVSLKSGGKKSLSINVLQGYRKPLLIHKEENGLLNMQDIMLKTSLYTARIIKNGEKYTLEITAEKEIKKMERDTIYIQAMKEHKEKVPFAERRNKNKGKVDEPKNPVLGVPLVITINP